LICVHTNCAYGMVRCRVCHKLRQVAFVVKHNTARYLTSEHKWPLIWPGSCSCARGFRWMVSNNTYGVSDRVRAGALCALCMTLCTPYITACPLFTSVIRVTLECRHALLNCMCGRASHMRPGFSEPIYGYTLGHQEPQTTWSEPALFCLVF
jgi:hypothetical protein